MIIILLIFATFVFAGFMIFGHRGPLRTSFNVVSFIVIAGSLIALVGNDNYHWGMHQVTQTQIQNLSPVRSPQAALMVKRLGTGSERVVVYRLADATKTRRTVADIHTTTKFVTGSPAQLQITTTSWQFRSHWSKLLFELGNRQTQVSHRQYLFTTPKNWQTVTLK